MTKHKHNPRYGLNALRHGPHHSTGAMSNPRHPRKLKLAPMDKKTAPSAANTEDGKEAQHDT